MGKQMKNRHIPNQNNDWDGHWSLKFVGIPRPSLSLFPSLNLPSIPTSLSLPPFLSFFLSLSLSLSLIFPIVIFDRHNMIGNISRGGLGWGVWRVSPWT